jgi:MFS family permease
VYPSLRGLTAGPRAPETHAILARIPGPWWTEADARARRAFVAAALGWMLDSFDVMLYALVVAELIRDPVLHLSIDTAGILGSVALLSAAAGGIVSGILADRIGRKRALMAAILFYSIFTAACGFARSALELGIFRALLGLGMGGDWATGAALVSESFPAKHRGKALAFVQSAWAIGYGLAALVNLIVLPRWGWRGVFFVGILPALVTLWIRRGVEEPQIWQDASADRGRVRLVFAPHVITTTIFLTLMNAATLFGYWAQSSWVPAYLALEPSRGGIGLSSAAMSLFVIAMQVGLWIGYVSFGYIADAIGRKRTYVTFLIMTSVLLPIYGSLRSPPLLLALGPIVSYFGGGFYSGFGAVIVELYPTAVRATAAGICYNTGRIASAAAPFVIGSLASTRGFGTAFALAGVSYLVAAMLWIWIPETGNAELV